MPPGTARRRVLLISSSTIYGTRYLDHAEAETVRAFAGASRVLFIPHALHDRPGYTAKARARFERMASPSTRSMT